MATSIQWLNNPSAKQTIVVSGKSAALTAYILGLLETRLKSGLTDVQRFSAPETSIRQLCEALADPQPWADRSIYIYQDVHQAGDLEPLHTWLDYPEPGRILILTANELRNAKNERWIPSDERVLYIDCSHLDIEQLTKFCSIHGFPSVDIPWLLDRSSGEISEILRVCDQLSVFPKPWAPGLVRKIYPSNIQEISFDQYAILDTANDITGRSLIRQLRRRFIQMTALATVGNDRLSIVELSQRAEAEPFIISRLFPLVKNLTPQQCVTKLIELETAAEYASQGFPVREYLACVL